LLQNHEKNEYGSVAAFIIKSSKFHATAIRQKYSLDNILAHCADRRDEMRPGNDIKI
jgi:hypothetical protein